MGGLLNVTNVLGTGPVYTLAVDDSTGVVIGDHVLAALLGGGSVDGGVYRVSDVPNGSSIEVTDDLEPVTTTYGKPAADDAQYYTPTTRGFSQPVDEGPFWAPALRRDNQLVDAQGGVGGTGNSGSGEHEIALWDGLATLSGDAKLKWLDNTHATTPDRLVVNGEIETNGKVYLDGGFALSAQADVLSNNQIRFSPDGDPLNADVFIQRTDTRLITIGGVGGGSKLAVDELEVPFITALSATDAFIKAETSNSANWASIDVENTGTVKRWRMGVQPTTGDFVIRDITLSADRLLIDAATGALNVVGGWIGDFVLAAGGRIVWTGRAAWDSPLDGKVRFTNNAGTQGIVLDAISQDGQLRVYEEDSATWADVAAGNLIATETGVHRWTNRTVLTAPADGRLLVRNNALNDFALLQLGGVTSSYPALKRSIAELQIRLADDSDYGDLRAKNLYADADIVSGTDVVVASASQLRWSNRTRASSPTDGDLRLVNNAGTDFGLLQFGGGTALYPAIKRNAAGLDFRTADDLGWAAVSASAYTAESTGSYVITARAQLKAPSDGRITVTDSTGLGFDLLQFGGTTTSYPAVKRVGAGFELRLANDSAGTTLVGTVLTGSTSLNTASGGEVVWASRSRLSAPSDGDLLLVDTAGSQGIRFNTQTNGWLDLRDEAAVNNVGLVIDQLRLGDAGIIRFGAAPGRGRLKMLGDGDLSLTNESDTQGAVFDTSTDGLLALFIENGTTPIDVSFGLAKGADGGASAPTYAFTSESNTGWYLSGANAMSLSIAGTPRFTIDGSFVNFTGTLIAQGLRVNDNARLAAPAEGQLVLTDDATTTTFDMLNFGGVSSAYPAWKRNGAGFDARLGDDTGYASLSAGAFAAYSNDSLLKGVRASTSATMVEFRYQDDDGVHLLVGNQSLQANHHLIITSLANAGKDHDHSGLAVDPIIYGHSATDPDADNTQWWSLTHDQTDTVFTSGAGGFQFLPNGESIRMFGPNGIRFYKVAPTLSRMTADAGTSSLDIDCNNTLTIGTGGVDAMFIGRSDTQTFYIRGLNQIYQKTLTTAGANDYGYSFTQELNAATGTGATYRHYRVDITATDTAGWDDLHFVDYLIDGTSKFKINFDGGFDASGPTTWTLPTLTSAGTDDYGIRATQTLNDTTPDAGGTQEYHFFDGTLTATTTQGDGWDKVYLFRLRTDFGQASVRDAFTVTADGDVYLGGPSRTGVIGYGDVIVGTAPDSVFGVRLRWVNGIGLQLLDIASQVANSNAGISAGKFTVGLGSNNGWHWFNNTVSGSGSVMGFVTVTTGRKHIGLFGGTAHDRNIIIGDSNYYVDAHGHGAQTHPTVFHHSATDPATDNTQYGKFFHDSVDYIIGTGKGDLQLNPATDQVVIANGAGGSAYLCLGGSTSAYPAWRRVGTTFYARLGDDSGWAPVAVKELGINGGQNSQGLLISTATTLLSDVSTSATATGLIPAGAIVLGVTARVTTSIVGATSFDIGDGSDVDAFGATIATTATTTSNNSDWTIASAPVYASATDVVLTPNGGAFTAGAVRLTVHYCLSVAPNS